MEPSLPVLFLVLAFLALFCGLRFPPQIQLQGLESVLSFLGLIRAEPGRQMVSGAFWVEQSASAERPRDAWSAFLTGRVTLRLNFRLKGNLTFRANIYWPVRWGNGYTTTLLLEVFTQRHFVADLIPLHWSVISSLRFSLSTFVSIGNVA